MKRELKHDILAEKIWERLPEQDKQLRQVRRSLEQRAKDYHAGKGSPLGAKELAAWENLFPKLRLETEISRFIEASRVYQREAEARKRRRQRWSIAVAVLVAAIAVVAAVVSYGYFLSAKKATVISEERRIEAEQSDSLAQISDSLAQISAAVALEQEGIAQAALRKSRITAGRTVPVLLNEADNYILSLQYDTALVRTQAAWDLDAERPKVALRFQEIAYFFTESGAYDKAVASLAYIGQRALPQRTQLLETLKSIDPDHYSRELEKRYYPDMVLVEGGTFWMGSDTLKDKDFENNELPRHKVTLRSFHIARTETTVWQYYLYTEADTGRDMPQPSSWQWSGDHPMVNVSWYDALAYANWVSRQLGEPLVYQLEIPDDPNDLSVLDQKDSINWVESMDWKASGYRLPTEAEWEYAARGGRKSKGYIFAGSDSLDQVGWFWENNDPYGAKAVNTKWGNELGLFDMSGNVWEWCWDWSSDYPESPEENYSGPDSGRIRMLRGGSWGSLASYARVSLRFINYPVYRGNYSGFRLARAVTF